MQENHLAKWLNNELTEAELTEFKKSEAYATYERIRLMADSMEAPEFDVEQALAAVQNQRTLKDSKVVRLYPFKKFLRVAAAIAVLVTASYFYLNTLEENVRTAYAENKEIVLPDNSEIFLNADSEIAYDEKNWNQQRTIELQGEAFFKVAKGKRFTVETEAGTITVLGTQFNVEKRKDFFEVSCYEGLVSVLFNGTETKLPAGSSLMAINGKVVEAMTPTTAVPSWINKESTFKSIPLRYVLDEFQRQHNVIVSTENVDLDQLYTGTFSNTNADLAMKSISVPSRIKFKFEGNKVLFYAENTP